MATMTRILTGSICLQYKWTLTPQQNVFSMTPFIGVPGLVMQEAFRLGAGTNNKNYLDRVCCYVNSIDLGKLGIRVRAVTCCCTLHQVPSNYTDIDDLWELEPIGEDQHSTLLFLYDSMGALSSRLVTPEITLTFSLYLSGAVDHFVPQCFDGTPIQSLVNAAWNQQHQTQNADVVVFQTGNQSNPSTQQHTFGHFHRHVLNQSSSNHSAHKFILVARSPVFKAMLDAGMMVESRTGQIQIPDMDDETLNEFLHFIYTGTLTKPVTQQLAMAAEKYQVETLTSICRTASARETALKKGLLTFSTSKKLRSCQDNKPIIDIQQQSQLQKTGFPAFRRVIRTTAVQQHTAVQLSTQTYTAQNISKQINKDAQWILDDVLLYKVENVNDNCKIIFYSDWMNDTMARRVSGVDLQVYKNDKIVRRCTMSPVVSLDSSSQQPLQVFTTGLGLWDCNDESSAFHFIVHYCLPSEGSKFQLRDSRLDKELWSSAVNKEWTDVEFQVGGKAFPAHKALLAACCPALAALIPAESSTSVPHKVPIPNMNPDVFEVLLYYLYTGTIKTSSIPNESLLKAAQAYSISALVTFCSKPLQQLNQNEFSEAVMSLV